MPLSGGPSAKAGQRYETLWTVMCLTQVMRGEAESIRLEPPGVEGEGIEFRVKTISGTEYHQVKRQRTGKGNWPLSILDAERVLSDFYHKLESPEATCVFVSAHAADTLKELAERAIDAMSWEEFELDFLSSDTWSRHFDELHSRWGSPARENTYQRLNRIRVRTVDEDFLRDSVRSRLEVLVDGDPDNVSDVLSALAMNRIHHELDSSDIWDHLESRGFASPAWAMDTAIADAIAGLNDMYLAGIEPVGIGTEVVPRKEIKQILEIFDSGDGGKTVLVTGKAGVGKSSVLSQTISEIETRGWPLLSLRVDRLEPSQSPADVGRHLGLPASPISVLASIADGRDCLLVVDQLDAVSLASGRNPEFFDCIGAILSQAQHHPNIRVLSACRRFDVDNDHRLKHLVSDRGIAEEIQIEAFDDETVRGLVKKLGMDASELSPKQLALLSLPVHLRLLAEVPFSRRTRRMDFQTSKDLYDSFWRHKRDALSSRVDIVQIRSVLETMISYMDRREVLFVPESLIDDYHDVVSAMASENVLVRDGPRVSFFHESFFDYMFARTTESVDFDLTSYVLGRDQSLFIRSQIRQILLHKRDVSPDETLQTVDSLLSNSAVRVHVKSIVLSLLGSLDDPSENEWRLIEPLLGSSLSLHLWSAIDGSLPWFDLLDANGTIQEWLADEDAGLVDRAVWLLHSIHEERSDRVVALLSPYADCSDDKWRQRLRTVITYWNIGSGRDLFELARGLIEAGAIDDLLRTGDSGSTTWYAVKRLAESDPEWACDLIAVYCDRLRVLAKAEGSSNPFLDNVGRTDYGGRVVIDVAKAAPRKFIELLMPFVEKVVHANAATQHPPPWSDPIWSNRIYGYEYGLDNNFYSAIESSMCWLIINEPQTFRRYAGRFQSSQYQTIQHLLLRSYEANGKCFADEAVEYILQDRALLASGYLSDPHWATRQLLEAVTPYCSLENLGRLEEMLLGYYTDFEMHASGRALRGYSQLTLLQGVDASRLSSKAAGKLRELRRKFKDHLPSEPTGMVAGYVGSPIPQESVKKMSDDNWLGAMERYSSDSPINDHVDFLKGGALQLSQELRAETKEHPARFARLVHRMPDDANPAYFEAILQGLAETELEADAVVSACLRCHRLPNRPLGRWITRPLHALSSVTLPDGALDMVAWYATQGPESDQMYSGADLLNTGINSVRGTAADSMARLILAKEDNLTYFEPHLRCMVNDPSAAVRALVAHALLGVLRHNRDLAVELFVKLCDADDELLATHYVETFLKYAVQTHYSQLEPVLIRMIESNSEGVATAGARQVCLASLTVAEALGLARRCVSGSEALRLGAAEIYCANLKMAAHREECEAMLRTLFSDPSAAIRSSASRCFLEFEAAELGQYQGLITAFIESPSFDTEFNPLIHALDITTARMPEITLATCEKYLDMTDEYGEGTEISRLVIRVYSQNPDAHVRSRCLDIIDRMSLLRTLGLDSVIDEFDR